VVFYAGRSTPDFQGFLGGVSDRCKNSPPMVITGDDVTEYVAKENIRILNTTPFKYAALTYDAAYSSIKAVKYLATGKEKISVTGDTLWRELASITGDKRYQGVTGPIDFGGVVTGHFPLNKPISVLQVEDGKPNTNEHASCGEQDDPATQPWCPFDD
jgi:hypothetical protein